MWATVTNIIIFMKSVSCPKTRQSDVWLWIPKTSSKYSLSGLPRNVSYTTKSGFGIVFGSSMGYGYSRSLNCALNYEVLVCQRKRFVREISSFDHKETLNLGLGWTGTPIAHREDKRREHKNITHKSYFSRWHLIWCPSQKSSSFSKFGHESQYV